MPALGAMLSRGAPPAGGAPIAPPAAPTAPMAGGAPPAAMPGAPPAGPPGGGDQIAVLKQLLSNPQVRQMVKALIAQAESQEMGVTPPGGLPGGAPSGAPGGAPGGAPMTGPAPSAPGGGYANRMPA